MPAVAYWDFVVAQIILGMDGCMQVFGCGLRAKRVKKARRMDLPQTVEDMIGSLPSES